MAQIDKSQTGYGTEFSSTPKQLDHIQAMAQEDHNFQLKLQEVQHLHEAKMKNKDLGWIGFLFGTAENASKNIAAIICLILIVGASIFSWNIYQCGSDNSFVETIWQIVLPVVTLSLGYIFGKKD